MLFKKTKSHPDYTVRCYLTLKCSAMCEFCSAQIPLAGAERRKVEIPADIWAAGINRRKRNTVLAGGEPFMYSQFEDLICLLDGGYKIEIYTNLRHDVEKFVRAANRPFIFLISLHPGTDLIEWRKRVEILTAAGHSLRFHIVRSAGYEKLAEYLKESGIVGRYRTALQGDQRAGPKSAGPEKNREHPWVKCTSKIILFGPGGYRYHCVHKMVTGDRPARFGHISESDQDIETSIECSEFGLCAGCDNNIEGSVIDVAT